MPRIRWATVFRAFCLKTVIRNGELKMVNFLDGDKVLGRPVDCAQAPDGSLVFSDDNGHKVYRLEYVGK